jgi:Mn2+/Fe2+ NRAMP family transporter
MEWSRAFFSVLVAILGTTISPYLFFWQAAQEVEEERALAVAVLAGSCAYAIAEASRWRGSLDRRPSRAKKFYAVLAVAMVLGIALNYAGLNAIKLLFTTAVINGVLAPPLILIVVLLTCDRTVRGDAVNSRTLGFLGWVTFAVMAVAALGLCVAS